MHSYLRSVDAHEGVATMETVRLTTGQAIVRWLV